MTKTFNSMMKAIVALTMVLSLVGASTASALTASDIAMLQAAGIISAAQAASLSASITSAPAMTTSSYAFTRDLTIGSTGADVTALQNILVNAGDLVMPAGVSMGYFGSLTQKAVSKWQAAAGITPTAGYFGAKSRAALAAMGGSSTVTTTGGSVVATNGTDLTVSLAPTSPVSGSVLTGQAAADLAEYTFTNTSATPAVVTNVTLQRTGVSADTLLSNVYLFNGATRLTDAATVSSGQVTFNSGSGIFTVAPGASITVAVKADIETVSAGASAGQTVAISLTGVTANIPVAGTYPISGSLQTTATATDLATVALTAVQPTASVNAGTLQDTIWQASLTQGGRAVWLKSLAVKVIGSIPSNSLANIGLYVSGVQVATASGVDANGMITFDLRSNPYNINSSRTLEVRADIVNGADRSFSVDLQNAADLQIVDSNYNVGITATGIPMSENTITVNTGSLSASLDSTLSSGNVVLGSTGVALAKYTLTSYGEDEKVSYLNITSTDDLENVTLYANGSSISSSQNVSSTTGTTFSLGSSLIVPAGQTVSLEVKGDLKNLSGNNLSTSSNPVVITLNGVSNNAQGSYSSQLTEFPSSPIVGPSLTIVGGGLTVAENAAYNNQTLTANTTGFKIGSFELTSNSSEPVRVTGLTVGLSGTLPLTSLANLYTSINSTKINPQSSNNFGANFTIPANSSQEVDVYADIGALPSGNTLVAATGSTTYAGYFDAGDSITETINGITFTQGSSVASTTATAMAAALASTIAGSSTSPVTASAAAGVITFTAKTAGTSGNSITTTAGATKLALQGTHSAAVSGTASGATLLGGASIPSTTATLTSSLEVTANGVNSNVDASQYSPIAGQNLTVGTGVLNNPTLTSDTPVAQLVIGGTTGSTIADYGFTATVGAATITQLDFNLASSTNRGITSITVGGVTSPVSVGATTTVSGLNIVIPVQNAVTEIPVTVAYNNVGTVSNGIVSDATTTLDLTHVKYTSGNATHDNYLNLAANSVYPVAGYPTIAIVSGSRNGLTTGSTLLGQVTVTAVGNTVNLRTLPITLTSGTSATTTSAILTAEVDQTNTIIASSTNAAGTSPANGTTNNYITFNNGGYQIAAGTTKTFDIYGTVTGTASVSTGDSITAQLGAATSVVWDDVNGGATGLNAALIPSYSTTNTSVITNQ